MRDPNGTVHSFDVPGGTDAVFAGYAAWSFHVGLGINNLGEIVGNGAQGVFLRSPDGSIQWFSVPTGTQITGINDSHRVVGYSTSSPPCQNFVSCGVVGDLNGPLTGFLAFNETFAYGINDLGQAVGLAHNTEFAFRRNADGTISSFAGAWGGGGPTVEGGAFGINDKGQIVGGLFLDFLNPVPATHGVIRNVDGTITLLDYPGGDNTVLTGINDSGELIGYTWHEFGTSQITTGFLAIPADAPSPEPSTMLLAGSTILLGFGATSLRRRHAPR